jgi:Family of unknown function (DUF6350)
MTSGPARPLVITGAIAACAAAGTGMVILTLLVLAGWIAAPHAAIGLGGLTGVLRVAAALWLIGHHVGFTLHGVGRIGLLPLGLVLLPGALLWRAGRWVVRAGGVGRLRHVGYAALALAVPYALLAAALALASRSALAVPSIPQAVIASFLLAVTAGGLGGARALAPWAQLAGLMSARLRSVIVGTVGSLAVLTCAGAVLAGASLGAHLGGFSSVNGLLAPGAVGAALLLLAQLAYVPNAVVWAISFTLGPGFAFGTGTVVAPTGSALGPLPAFPMLASLPQGPGSGVPPWLSVTVLALPFLAGAIGGLLLARAAPTPALEAAALWGFACGVLTGCVLGVLAAFAGGSLGEGRLAAVGPSPWQVGTVAALEVGVAAAVAAGAANWRRLRAGKPLAALRQAAAPDTRPAPGRAAAAAATSAAAAAASGAAVPGPVSTEAADDGGHIIYLDRWAGEQPAGGRPPRSRGPSALP